MRDQLGHHASCRQDWDQSLSWTVFIWQRSPRNQFCPGHLTEAQRKPLGRVVFSSGGFWGLSLTLLPARKADKVNGKLLYVFRIARSRRPVWSKGPVSGGNCMYCCFQPRDHDSHRIQKCMIGGPGYMGHEPLHTRISAHVCSANNIIAQIGTCGAVRLRHLSTVRQWLSGGAGSTIFPGS